MYILQLPDGEPQQENPGTGFLSHMLATLRRGRFLSGLHPIYQPNLNFVLEGKSAFPVSHRLLFYFYTLSDIFIPVYDTMYLLGHIHP